ncbi:hypothetical protein R6Q59_014062 [Mikania micrantha]
MRLLRQGGDGLQVDAYACALSNDESRIDEREMYNLDAIRRSLIRLEDSIIYSLIERAQYCHNKNAYDPGVIFDDGFQGSLVDFMIKETEKVNAKVLHSCAMINFNKLISDVYFDELLPRLAKKGDDGNYESTSTCDTICLQLLSKRIHYGKFVAEAKFRASPDEYEAAIRAKDMVKLMKLLTYPDVEAAIIERVEKKSKTYGGPSEFISEPDYKNNADLVTDL